jgi:DNA gyrase/topoisomerase IV subunit B
MTQAILNQILEQLKTLEVEELRQLNQVIQKRLADKEEAAQRSTFHEALLASGLVKQIKEPAYRQQTKQRLIQVQGKPVSKTIIEERR